MSLSFATCLLGLRLGLQRCEVWSCMDGHLVCEQLLIV